MRHYNKKFEIRPEDTTSKLLKIAVRKFILLNQQYVCGYKLVSFV